MGLSASRSILMPSADLAALQRVNNAPNVKLDLYFDPKAKDFRLLMNQVATSGFKILFNLIFRFIMNFDFVEKVMT